MIFEKRFSLCYPQGIQGFPQKMSAHSIQPWPAIADIQINIYIMSEELYNIDDYF